MNKRLIKLTEQDLHRIVKESVNRILMESKGLDPSKRDSEFASNIKWSDKPDLDSANRWRKSEHASKRGVKKVKGDTKFRDMARRENERGNFVHKLKTNPNEWFEKSVRESIDSLGGMPQISWKYDGTEVYLNGLYAGYIDPIGQIGGWYGKVNCIKDGRPTMETFGVSYDKTEIQQQITDFINKNYDNVLESCENMARLNNR